MNTTATVNTRSVSLSLVRSMLATSTALALPAVVCAQPTVREYPIPRAGAFPHDPAVGADGMVWYTDQANSYIGRFDPTTEQFVDYPTPTPGSGPHGITVAADGFVWYTGQSTGRLGRVDPTTGQITEYVLPANANRPHTPIAHAGAIWFTAQTNDTYGRFDPVTLQTQVWNAPSGSRPYGIAPAPDGSLWMALFGTNRLGRIDVTNGALTLFALPDAAARPRRLVVANDGLVYYSDFARGFLGRLDPATGQVREWRSPGTNPQPYGIWTGTDSRIWFDTSQANLMVAFDPRSEQMQSVAIPTSGNIVRNMTWDFARGRLWLALSGTGRIGRIQLEVPATVFGSACSGSLGIAHLAVGGAPRFGETLVLGVRNTAAPVAVLFAGQSDASWNNVPLPLSLGFIGAPACSMHAAWDLPVYSGAPGEVSLSVPRTLELGGSRLFFQWALAGEAGHVLTTTEAARIVIVGI
ncbi:MAG: hypothetical protein R3F56_13000 [Planctomycetota bacterium]